MTDFKDFQENATLIVGHARSGTTLLKNLFDHHPQMVVFPVETHLFKWINCKDKVDGFLKNTSLKKHRRKYYGINSWDIEEKLQGKFRKAKHNKDIFLALMEMCYEMDSSLKDNKKRWLEKTPAHLSSIPIFKKWFKTSLKIIYIYRDPRDIFVSIRKKYPLTKLVDVCLSYDLSYRVYLKYKDCTDSFIAVKFEDLLTKPKGVMQKLCKFLNIEFNEGLLQQTINGKYFSGNSRFGDQFTSISTTPIGRYINNLSVNEISRIEYILYRPMKEFGYITDRIPRRKMTLQHYIFKTTVTLKLLLQKMKGRLSEI